MRFRLVKERSYTRSDMGQNEMEYSVTHCNTRAGKIDMYLIVTE